MSEALQITIHFHGDKDDVNRVVGIIKASLPDFDFRLFYDGDGKWALVPSTDSKYFVEIRTG
jgi:hypothetical protein